MSAGYSPYISETSARAVAASSRESTLIFRFNLILLIVRI